MILTYSTINIKRVGVITLQETALEGREEVPRPEGRAGLIPPSPHLFLNEGNTVNTCPTYTCLSNTTLPRTPSPDEHSPTTKLKRTTTRTICTKKYTSTPGTDRGNSKRTLKFPVNSGRRRHLPPHIKGRRERGITSRSSQMFRRADAGRYHHNHLLWNMQMRMIRGLSGREFEKCQDWECHL